jgi:hypothetical protein
MCRRAGRLDKVKYLNATAYILGYVITRGGKKIDNKLMQKAFANLRYMNDDSVKPSEKTTFNHSSIECGLLKPLKGSIKLLW